MTAGLDEVVVEGEIAKIRTGKIARVSYRQTSGLAQKSLCRFVLGKM
jgi:hypothetical protein